MKTYLTIFFSVFIAELGDKTQLATLMFATDNNVSKTGVFIASSLALVLSSLLAVLIGSQLSNFVDPKILKILAGSGFIVIGVFVLFSVRNA
jgi:putative Ca2+/H+ antiporter (TMEM165/GDT1 family)